MGREDGSLLLAKRLLWERTPRYTLNISVTDGLHTVYAPVGTSMTFLFFFFLLLLSFFL